MGDIGWEKIVLILFVALLIFGAKKIPEIGRGLGRGIREFRDATKGLSDDVRTGLKEEPKTSEGTGAAEVKPQAERRKPE
jgi:sec-independent protein translocase protein TatA